MINSSDIKIVRQSRKSISLHVLSDGTIEVRAPKLIPKVFINEFIKRNTDWIEERIGKVKSGSSRIKKFEEGEEFTYLGKKYKLTYGNYTKIKIEDDKLFFPLALKFRAKKEIENWYIKQARQVITEQVNYYAKEMRTSYLSISFSDTSSKWGSCTHDNKLQFNWRLIMSPFLVLRYVVIHELAHTTEKNHSRSFWARVAKFNPSYKEQVKWLRKNGHGLVL